ncbi:TolC family protein [Ancylomarina sp. 16SWW S1-10-2]|nr:TolC family protein [Ancylomarina sp. 16SWW S1-10-2]
MLNSQVEIKNSEVKIVHSDYLPQLISFANYRYQNPDHLAQNEGELTWNAGLSLSIPVFHWGERKLKVIQSKMNLESSKNTLERTKELVVLEMHQSIFNLKEALVKLDFTLEALEQSEENLALETNRLTVEVATTTDLLNAQSQWQKAHVDYISAKVNVKINEAKYYKSIGALNP